MDGLHSCVWKKKEDRGEEGLGRPVDQLGALIGMAWKREEQHEQAFYPLQPITSTP